jgi:hypothetical protein
MTYSEALKEIVSELMDGDKVNGKTLHDFMPEIMPDDVVPILLARGDDLVDRRDAYLERVKDYVTRFIEDEYSHWIYERISDYDADQRLAMADARRMMEEAI